IRDRDLQLADWALIGRYFDRPRPAYEKLVEGILALAYAQRSRLLASYSPFLDRPLPRQRGDWSDPSLRTVDGFGWPPAPEQPPPPERLRLPALQYALHVCAALADSRVSPLADRALRELLDTCARHGVRPALVLVPEHSVVRAFYPPEARSGVHAYLA